MAVQQPGVWGIDLGQCALKAIRLEVIDGEVTATAFDYIEHPKILSQPDADPDQLTREALDKFLSRNSLRGDVVAISVPGQSGLARFVKLPPVEEKKIVDIVRFEAKQQIPFPLEEVVWDYQKLSSGLVTDGFALETEVGLFAMKRDMVNRYLQHFQDVNVEVHVIQMAPLALVNFVAHDLLAKTEGDDGEEEDEADEDSGKKQCVVALDIGTDNSSLVITDAGKIIWQRPIPIGGNHFTRALTKDLKLTFAKAEHLKRNAVKSPDLKKILGALRPVLNDFVSEVQRSLGYFTNTHRDAHIKFMIGLGNAFRLPGMQKFLQEKLQLQVRKLGEFKRLHGESVTTAPQFTENILSFAVAHGLALQGLQTSMIHTNLLPQEIRTERLIRAKKPWAAIAAAVLLLGVAGLAFGRARQHAAWNNEAVEEALKKGKTVVAEANGYRGEWQKAEDEAKASHQTVLRIAAGVHERFNWNLLYQYLGECLPRPDGQRLTRRTMQQVDAYTKYFKAPNTGEKALADARARRAAGPTDGAAGADEAKTDKAIKENLVQLNVEAITSLYADDLTPFWEKLKKDKHLLYGMRLGEAKQIKDGDTKLPKVGWLVEIRGYTYHRGGVKQGYQGERFIIDTLVENLANPDGAGLKPVLTEAMQKQVRERVKYVFLYKYELDKAPMPGAFRSIQTSLLPAAIAGTLAGKGPEGGFPGGRPMGSGSPMGSDPMGGEGTGEVKPAGPDRSAWKPLGEVASAGLGGGIGPGGEGPGPGGRPMGGVPVPPPPGAEAGPGGQVVPPPQPPVPRTEFVIFFLWEEPLTPDGTTPTADPAQETTAPPA